jgi:tartrate-resistant acid phosphatase type 5
MKFRFLFAVLICVRFVNGIAQGQNPKDLNEYNAGYRGGFIKGLTVPDSALNFLVIGDWGRCGEFYQKEVAEQLSYASVSGNASFIISTGDNFYPSGVAGTEDPLWEKSFENIYTQFSLQKDWYVVLGNHDYKINPQAEVEYSKKSSRWIMPSRYYSVKMPLNGDTNSKVLFVFMDTSPLIDKYYSDAVYGKTVKSQDTSAQKRWLIQVLSDKDPTIKWKFVVGHHPLYTSGKRIKSGETLQFRKLTENIFKQYKVDAYLCGHEHQLEYIKPAGRTHYFISGAGSEVREVKGDLPESVFKASDHGFMLFSMTKSHFKVQVINWTGAILNEQVITR